MVVLALLALTGAVFVTVLTVDGDTRTDARTVLREALHNVEHVQPVALGVVLALTVGHYLATAIAARAAAGIDLRFPELLRVQFAAAAANRLTPAGLGGSALTARYLTRRGLPTPTAAGAVAALAVLGALADLGVLVVIVTTGRWLGIGGGPAQLTQLIHRITSVLGPLRSPWLWAVVGVLLGVAGGLALTRRRHDLHRLTRDFGKPVRALAAHPRRLVTLTAASGMTTLMLGIAFVATTHLLPGPTPHAGIGTVLIAFMLGAAAGSSVPIPAGLGSTETALIAVLVATQVPATHAVQVVLVYRLITFWAPAVVGVFLARGLRRTGAL